MTLLAALFPAVEAELLAACESSRQLPALMQASSMRLGRLLELAREVYALEARMPLQVAALAVGGACVTLHFSFFQTRAKFGVALSLHGEDPQQPLAWQLQPGAGAHDGSAALAPTTMVDAALLQRTVADACEPHCTCRCTSHEYLSHEYLSRSRAGVVRGLISIMPNSSNTTLIRHDCSDAALHLRLEAVDDTRVRVQVLLLALLAPTEVRDLLRQLVLERRASRA